MVKEFALQHGPALRSLAVLGTSLATVAALVVGVVLVVFFAATVAVIALMASVLLAFTGLALRARRGARARRREDGVIEARHLGGHLWVAYGWRDRP